MLFRLFLLFTIVPIVELALLIKVGEIIGFWNTVAIVIITAVLGAYLVKMEGIGVMRRIQLNLQQGVFPAEELLDGAMILVAGALLLTPGFFTDFTGFLFVFPPSRAVIKKIIMKYLEKRIKRVDVHFPDDNFPDNHLPPV